MVVLLLLLLLLLLLVCVCTCVCVCVCVCACVCVCVPACVCVCALPVLPHDFLTVERNQKFSNTSSPWVILSDSLLYEAKDLLQEVEAHVGMPGIADILDKQNTGFTDSFCAYSIEWLVCWEHFFSPFRPFKYFHRLYVGNNISVWTLEALDIHIIIIMTSSSSSSPIWSLMLSKGVIHPHTHTNWRYCQPVL